MESKAIELAFGTWLSLENSVHKNYKQSSDKGRPWQSSP